METFGLEQPLCDYNESMDALPELWESNSFDSPIGDNLREDETYPSEAWSCMDLGLTTHEEVDGEDCLSQSPMVILRDRLITDAAFIDLHKTTDMKDNPVYFQSLNLTTPVKAEHSYSILVGIKGDIEMSEEMKPSVPTSETTEKFCTTIPVTIKMEPPQSPSSPHSQPTRNSKESSKTSEPYTSIRRVRDGAKTHTTSTTRLLLPRLNVQLDSTNGNFMLPPTPPSSTSSDSEGSLSPVREVTSPKIDQHSPTVSNMGRGISQHGRLLLAKAALGIDHGANASVNRQPINSPLISYQPKGSTGVLQLTEEEKRTLLAEGYPVPTRLPLTKTEEKSLKKIRRKIKNKISAQESRRKKKEYMDTLERRAASLADENADYRHRLSQLEADNVALQLQLKRLQQLLNQSGVHLPAVEEKHVYDGNVVNV